MSKPVIYAVVRYVGGSFMPNAKIIFKNKRLNWVQFVARTYKKYRLPAGAPLAICDTENLYKPIEWLVPWATEDPRKEMEPVDYVEGRRDATEIKENMITGGYASSFGGHVDEPLPISEAQIKKEVDNNSRKIVLLTDLDEGEIKKLSNDIKKKVTKKPDSKIILK